jgi:hypothetical protein
MSVSLFRLLEFDLSHRELLSLSKCSAAALKTKVDENETEFFLQHATNSLIFVVVEHTYPSFFNSSIKLLLNSSQFFITTPPTKPQQSFFTD